MSAYLRLRPTTNFITGRLHSVAVPVMRVCDSHAPRGPCYLPCCNEQLQLRRADIFHHSIDVHVISLPEVLCPVA